MKKTAKRTLILGMSSVLDEDIKSLLKSKLEFEVVSVTHNDPNTFLQDVARVHPDVIVLSGAVPLDWALTS